MADNQTIEGYRDLFQKAAFGHLATLMPDGSPQVTPVWVDYDGTHLLVNTVKGRQKALNMQRDRRVAIDIQDPDQPFRYLQVRGHVAEITEQGAEEHIDSLARKYTGDNFKNRRPDRVRVIYKILPEHASGQ